MSLRGFQQALCDLIASPELCLSLRRGEEGALGGFDLTDRERRRLEAVVRQRGMSVNCTLYRANRITPLYLLMPRSCLLLGDDLSDVVSEFWLAEATDMQFGPEVERFARFLRDRVDSGSLDNSYLPEMLDFELALNSLRFAPRRRLLAELARREVTGSWEANPLQRVVRFEHDPDLLLETLAERRDLPAEMNSGEFYLLLDGSAAEPSAQLLDPRIGRVLSGLEPGARVSAGESPDLAPLVEAGLLVPA